MEIEAGYLLWDTPSWEGAISAYGRSPWDKWEPTVGARMEIRF